MRARVDACPTEIPRFRATRSCGGPTLSRRKPRGFRYLYTPRVTGIVLKVVYGSTRSTHLDPVLARQRLWHSKGSVGFTSFMVRKCRSKCRSNPVELRAVAPISGSVGLREAYGGLVTTAPLRSAPFLSTTVRTTSHRPYESQSQSWRPQPHRRLGDLGQSARRLAPRT